nr:hypothetical protein [Corynebacterium lactis]
MSINRFAARARRTLVPAAVLAASASLLLATDAGAANVVPGADSDSLVVITDSGLLKVEVDAADAGTTAITGQITNTSGLDFTCAGPKGSDSTAGDISTASVISKSENYYRTNVFRVLPNLPVKTPRIPVIGQIEIGNANLDSLSPLLQGAGNVLGQSNGDRKKIADEYSKTRVDGHAGLIPKLTVNKGETVKFNVPLSPPSSGARTDFDAAAFLMCTQPGTTQPYVFTGYENGTRPPARPGSSSIGSPGLPSPSGS